MDVFWGGFFPPSKMNQKVKEKASQLAQNKIRLE